MTTQWKDEAKRAADAAQATADDALEASSLVWVPVTINVPDNDRGVVACPFNGYLVAIRATANFTPDDVMHFATSIGGIFAGGGAFDIDTDYFEDLVVSAVPTVDNASNTHSSARVLHTNNTNTVPGQVTVLLGFSRTP